MFSFFSSFGASSNFQKHRLILTSKNYQFPDQNSFKKILQTFRGEDQQTRSQIAFATIVKKIHTSDSKDNWIYLLKNLIILDRVVEENCFLDEISVLQLKPIQNYQQKIQQAKALNSQRILKSFWNLIQYKSSLLCQKDVQNSKGTTQSISIHKNNLLKPPNTGQIKQIYRSSFNKSSKHENNSNDAANTHNQNNKHKRQALNQQIYNQRSIISILRSQKQQFLKGLDQRQLYKQSILLQTLFQYIFRVIVCIDHSGSSNQNQNMIFNFRQENSKSDSLSQHMSSSNSKMHSSGHSNKNHPQKVYVNNFQTEQQSSNNLYQKLLTKGKQSPQHFPPKNSKQRENANSSNDSSPSNHQYSQKFKTIRQQFFNSKLIGYLHLQLLYKLISAYTNQLFCIKAFINLLSQKCNQNQGKKQNSFTSPNKQQNIINKSHIKITQKDIHHWKRIIAKYINYSSKIINYVQRHKNIKGFEVINYNQLTPFQNINILSMLDDYIQHKNTMEEPDIVKVQELGNIIKKDQQNIIKVQKKAVWTLQKALTARKTVMPARQLGKNNSFYIWQNNYSENFPAKQVLTLDLIMQIRQNPINPATLIHQEQQNQQQKAIYQQINHHSCVYNLRQSNISANSQFQFVPLQKMKQKYQQKLQSNISIKTKNFYYFKHQENQNQFKNIYSSLSKVAQLTWIK